MSTVQRWTGRESRALRQAMRLSVRDFSAKLGVAIRTVTKWEAEGVRAQLRPDSQALLDTVHHQADDQVRTRFTALLVEGAASQANDDALGARGREEQAGSPARTVEVGTQPLPALPTTAGWARAHESEDEDVQRRMFLKALAAAGTASAPAHAGVETLRHDLVAAVGGAPADLADWEAIAWEYGRMYAVTPPLTLLEYLVADLFIARERLEHLRDDVARAGMQGIVAKLAVFMAHTLGNLGDTLTSCRWWRVARGCAAGSSNDEIRVWVAGREIIGGLYERRPPEALLALADGAAGITPIPGMGTGSVLIGRAQVLAVLGREREAIQAMTQVYALLEHLPARVTDNVDSLYGWSECRLRHGESFVYSYLGLGEQAAAAQERAMALYPQHMSRERVQIRLHQAMCMVRGGDSVGGARYAGHLLAELPDNQRTEVVREVARSVVRAMPVSEQRRSEVLELRKLLALPSAVSTARI